MNSFFVPQLGSQIYTMAGMVTRLHLQADHAGQLSAASRRNYSGDGFSDMRFTVDAVPTEDFARLGRRQRAAPVRCSTRKPMPIWPSPAKRSRLSPIAPSPPTCSTASWAPHAVRSDPSRLTNHDVTEGGTMNLLGKLSWSAIPFDQPIVMGASAVMVLGIVRSPCRGSRSRDTGPICGASGSPPSTTSASASCIACWRWSCCCAASPTRS